MNTCNISIRTTCRRRRTCSSSSSSSSSSSTSGTSSSSNNSMLQQNMQQQQAAEATSSSKHLPCGPPHPRWNQRHHEKIAPICSLSSSATMQNNKNEMKKSDEALVPNSTLHAVAPCQRLTQTDLASCRLRMSIPTTPAAQSQLHSNDPGMVKP